MRGLCLGLFLLVFAGYGQSGAEGAEPRYQSSAPQLGKVYLFVVNLQHNPLRLFQTYGPLIDYLNRNVPGARFRLEASPDCDQFNRMLRERQVDFALANAVQALNSPPHGYHVIAKMADDRQYVGVILVRRDSGIREVTDLKGKKVAYPSRNCLMGAIMPQYYLHTHGLDVKRDIENLYVGSHESAIMNVYLGNVAAAAARRPSWELFQQQHPDQARELVARWETESLISPAVLARDDVPPHVASRVAQLLDTLHNTEEGRAILARMQLSRFELADDARYRVVEPFVRQFDQTIRPLKDLAP